MSPEDEAIIAIRRSIRSYADVNRMLQHTIFARELRIPVDVSEMAQAVIGEAFEEERYSEMCLTVDGLRRFMLRLVYRIEARGTEPPLLRLRFLPPADARGGASRL